MVEKFKQVCETCKGRGNIKILGFKAQCAICDGKGYLESDNVVYGDFAQKDEISSNTLLPKSVGKLKSFVIVGFTNEGQEYFESSMDDGPTALWLLQRASLKLLNIVDKNKND